MASIPACRLPLAATVLAAISAAAHTSAAQAENMRHPVREHVSFTYQKIVWSVEKAKTSSVWIRNGQPHTSTRSGDALADLPPPPGGPALRQPDAAPKHAAAGPNSASPLRRRLQARDFGEHGVPKPLSLDAGRAPHVPALPNHKPLNLKASSLYGLSNMSQ